MISIILESALRSLALGAAVWIALKALNVRNTYTQMLAWTAVLCAALLMPLLMQWRTVSVSLPAAHITSAAHTRAAVPAGAPLATSAHSIPRAHFDWRLASEVAYLAVGLILMLRMAIGLLYTWRLVRRAVVIREPWAEGSKVRASTDIAVPVTFGATILLPSGWPQWDETKLRAVMAHERSHVHRADFYLQTLSALHRVVFWFSPLAWMLHERIADLAEAASDDAALLDLRDRPVYAEILMQFARHPEPARAGVAMARRSTVSRRIDRILTETRLASNTGLATNALVVATIAGLVALAAGCTLRAQSSPTPNSDQPYAIFSGPSTTITGSSDAIQRAVKLRNKISGDFIWFEHNGKSYCITDPDLVARAKELFRPEEELGDKMGALGELQGKLGEEQGHLGELQSEITVPAPDFTKQLEALKKELDTARAEFEKSASKEIGQDAINDLQSKLGDLQGQLGELQSKAGEKQSKLGELQSKLGEEQSKLGEQQSALGEQQSRLAEQASKQLRKLLDEALRNGLAKPVE